MKKLRSLRTFMRSSRLSLFLAVLSSACASEIRRAWDAGCDACLDFGLALAGGEFLEGSWVVVSRVLSNVAFGITLANAFNRKP